MIRHLRGRLIARETQAIVVEAGGVGYGLAVSVPTSFRLAEPGEEVSVHVHTHVYETGIDLYGFLDPSEREVFLRLIAVSGIGPRLAINILSGMEADDLLVAVADGAIPRLVKIPGVGKKTAERIVVELKDKFRDLQRKRALESGSTPAAAATEGGLLDDVRSALSNLGYKTAAVNKIIPQLTKSAEQEVPIQDLIREALRLLQK